VFLAGCEGDIPLVADSDYPQATYYTVVVRPGDTVSRIAARYDASPDDVADLNKLTDASHIRPGQTLRIPADGSATREAVLGEASNGSARNYAPPPKPIDVNEFSSRERVAVRALPPVSSTKTQTATRVADKEMPRQIAAESSGGEATDDGYASRTDARFAWPVAGEVISPFGTYGRGERNDGINIAASEGTPIHAAAAGTVTYAGNGLKGYGNLVLIQHEGGYITAYAHAGSIDVNRGEHVERGQIIGLAGATGDVDRPQLHFEIRKGVQPVNPRLLLASKD
jgi:murein DD-endopeptidase MepM/ murein hydrolase activator NlpD